ncbi:hypothetical protein GcM3_177012 [Golovinomyces cichoracearum]|uniref:Integrase and RNaseH domain-containing protein n=1 Tax=Golovinomyces cichoracearum TaxID=62708 RepID=A0A420HNU4_9PEZI|nr:hypothetical protein GcM3_177012 [Golovinomyces cichoracearum]
MSIVFFGKTYQFAYSANFGSIKGKDFTFNDSDSEKEQTQCFEVTRALTKELATFIKAQYEDLKSEELLLDYELWATYTEIFKPVRFEQWIKLNISNRGKLSQLRSKLRNRGFWVDNEAKQDTALFNCAQERIRGQLSSNEIDLIKESGGTPTFGMLLQVKKSQSRAQTYDQIDSNEKKLPQSQSSSESKRLQQSTKNSYANILQSHPPLCNSFAAICSAMTNHFEGPESKVNAVNKWNSLKLLTRKSSDPQKTTAENFEAFVSELRKLQYKLPSDFLTEQFLHMKLMTACREVPACVLACYRPASDLPTFINDLRNSICTKETSATTSELFYADRRFRSSNEHRSRNDPPRDIRGK